MLLAIRLRKMPTPLDRTPTMIGEWWQISAIYQVYPRSFQDSNHDGTGDLQGIISRLAHFIELGVGTIWLSPVFTSPMADFGYDISDYTGIDPLFGTMRDFNELLAACHSAGLKVLLDLVPNHTSAQHPWFLESRTAVDNPKRDWFLWRDPSLGGGPPNNWISQFGGSGWEYDVQTGQYYYHTFLKEQPDLNWHNPEVREAIHDVMRFWLERGVDGFRADAIWYLLKDEQFRNNPENPNFRRGEAPQQALIPLYTADHPGIHAIIRGMRRVVDEFPKRVLLGEIYLPIERIMAYYGRDLDGTHFPFNFSLLETKWEARVIARLISEYEGALPPGGWPNWVLGNHDRPRIATRVGPDQARIAAMLLLTLRGTPTIYYGDEIGLENVPIEPGQVQDPFEKNVPGMGLGRDGVRTPMQWDATVNAGFTSAQPWLPVSDDYETKNVGCQRDDPATIYNLYRRLFATRRQRSSLSIGCYQPIAAAGDLLLFVRQHEDERTLVALNFGSEPLAASLAQPLQGQILMSTFTDRASEAVNGEVSLRPHEGLMIDIAVGSEVPRATI
jgi:alpha-glucosidase